jgi:hypothetical protein
MADDSANVNTPQELGSELKRWQAELNTAMRPEEKFRKRAKGAEDRYRDEKDEGLSERQRRRFNILWSNSEILKAALYANDPKPIIERRYRDQDPVGRVAAQALDRAINYHIDQTQFSSAMRRAVFDAILPGRGTVRVRYKPEYGPPMPGVVDDKGQPVKPVVYEEAATDYVHWSDFLTAPCRIWEDCRWISFRALMTKTQLEERFGKEKAADVPLAWNPNGQQRDSGTAADEHQLYNRAEVFEIWHKTRKEVLWIVKDYEKGLLDKQPDPLGLRAFFPCPQPLAFNGTNSDIIPIPEYDLYRDQADEIDTLTTRINNLIRAVRVAGVYDATNAELSGFLTAVENSMTPLKNWTAFAEKGGMKGAMDWLPLEPIVASIVQLAEARERIKQELYEVTGIGDIIRGASDPDETATAQRIKGRFAGLRLEDKQKKVAEFARETIELMTEIVGEHFSPETLKLMTGLKLPETPEEAQMIAAQQAMAQMASPLAA